MQSLSLRDSHFDSASDSEFLAALSYCFLTGLFFSPLQFSPSLFPSIYLSIYRLETLQYRPSRPRFRLCRVSIIYNFICNSAFLLRRGTAANWNPSPYSHRRVALSKQACRIPVTMPILQGCKGFVVRKRKFQLVLYSPLFST